MRERQLKRIADARDSYNKYSEKLEALVHIKQYRDQVRPLVNQTIQLADSGQDEAAANFLGKDLQAPLDH